MKTTYVWRDGRFVEKGSGEPMPVLVGGPIALPMIIRDIPEYRSPIDGRLITSRSARREDLIRNDCVEVDPPKRERGFKNPRFAKRHNLKLNEDAKNG